MSVAIEGPWGAPEQSLSAVEFSGKRGELFGRLLGGYLLMLLTLGLYHFWLTTAKRRFYWHNTVIGGDRLEYSGSPLQLLVGFLFAIGVFLPIYLAFFYLSFQSSTVAMLGYGAAALLLWFLSGYASYRGRDFRLSRTLWRGIRFDQKGSAIGYAVRRFFWSLLVLLTAGLAFPFMAGNLWRYRYANTWFGDQQFTFAGSWKTVAGPFYRAWLVFAASVGLSVWLTLAASDLNARLTIASLSVLWLLPVLLLCLLYYRSRETTRMLSRVKLGDAALSVRVKARALFGQYLLYGICLAAALIVIAIIGFVIKGAFSANFEGADFSPANIARAGWIGAVLAAGGYLVTVSTFTLLGEVFIDCGYWMLVSRGATITNLESLESVGATHEDKSLAGEGLADALNVGSF